MVALLALVLVGCGGDGDGRRAREDVDPATAALVASMWAQDSAVVEVGPPITLHLPGPGLPDGTALTAVARPDEPAPADTGQDPFDPTGAAQTLYADPSAPVPEEGPALVVGRTQTSDIDGGLILIEGDVAAPARPSSGATPGTSAPVDVGHDDAERVEVDGLLVIRWPLPVECACDQVAFVAARGVEPEVVVAAARAADVGAPRPFVPEAERDGLRSLGTVAGSFRDLPPWSAYPERLTVRHDGAEAQLEVHRGDPRIVAHTRFWAPGGRLVSPFPVLHRVMVLDDGAVAHATAHNDAVATMEPVVDEVLASLVPATDDDLGAAQAEILARVPLPPCDPGAQGEGPDPVRGDLHGTAGTARWVFGITVVDGNLLTCDQVAPAGDIDTGAGSLGVPGADIGGDAPIELLAGSTTGTGDGPTYRFVAGHVADDVTEVVVEATGLTPAEADIADAGPRPGRHWFAAVLDVTPLGFGEVEATVVARRSDGSEAGRVPVTGPSI